MTGMASAALFFAAPAGAVVANTYYVGTTVDDNGTVPAATCENPANTTCALRDAIANANSDGAGSNDTILFSVPSPSVNTLNPLTGGLDISDTGTLTITGHGESNTTISGANGTQVFFINAGPVTMSGLTITGGRSNGPGGGIEVDSVLTMTNVAVTGNVAAGSNARGGGIYSDGTLNVTGSNLSGNSADDCGGALNTNGGTATLNQVTVASNTSDCGGGIEVENGALVLTNSTVNDNFARDYDDGGGIEDDSMATLTNDTIANNVSLEYGGGLAVESGHGATLVNDTITGNNALEDGGGIYVNSSSSVLDIQGTVLAGNVNYISPNQCFGYGTITSMGWNVVAPEADTSCNFNGPGDQVNTDPEVGGLANNGGPTLTEALSPTSPALNVEPVASCPAQDQRGISRPQPSSAADCDAGAFELVPNPPPAYLMAGVTGGVYAFNTPFHGSPTGDGISLNDVVDIVADPGGAGYWVIGGDGGVFAYGAAPYKGSLPGVGGLVVDNIVSAASDTAGDGYVLADSSGGVHAFGLANEGDLPSIGVLVSNIIGIAETPDGGGYWMVGLDGGVFAFGDAHYYGSMGGKPLNEPIVNITATPDGKGYWLVAADGGVFGFGDAKYWGGMGGKTLNQPVVALVSSPDGKGYWEIAADGGTFNFGDAAFGGSLPGLGVHVNNIIGAA